MEDTGQLFTRARSANDMWNIGKAAKADADLIRSALTEQNRLFRDTERRARRDRFIAAALTGLCSNSATWDRSERCRVAIMHADAVLSLLDTESFERESEGKL